MCKMMISIELISFFKQFDFLGCQGCKKAKNQTKKRPK